MLTRILHPSEQLCTFVHSLGLRMSQPQLDHLIRLADALLVWEGPKTLAALQRQFVEAPDPSNWADFLRIGPWLASEVRAAVRARQVAWLVAEAERAGAPRVIYINLDDSLGEKDPHTRHIEPVAWFFDHTDNTYKNGFCHLVCTMRVGENVAKVDLRPTCGRRPFGVSTGIGCRSAGSPSGANTASPRSPILIRGYPGLESPGLWGKEGTQETEKSHGPRVSSHAPKTNQKGFFQNSFW